MKGFLCVSAALAAASLACPRAGAEETQPLSVRQAIARAKTSLARTRTRQLQSGSSAA